MAYCSACGSEIEKNERFCTSCGEQQQPEVRVTPDRRPPARKAGRLLLILIPLVLIAVVAAVILLPPAPVITVPGDFPTIQAAIDAAQDGDIIVVEPGTYRENIDFRGKAITVRSTAPDDPQVVADTIIDGGNNGSVVTFRSGETAQSVLSGFTITGGSGTWETFEFEFEGVTEEVEGYFGGGILVMMESSPAIENNTITGNTAKAGGGIAVMMESSPAITGNTITGNTADYGGGIAVAVNSSPAITGNTITGNTAKAGGGIAVAVNSSPAIGNNTITGNTADYYGGGIDVLMESSPAIENNTITGNTAKAGGGIAVDEDSSPAITGNTITDNRAERGGAIWVSACSTLQLKTPDDNIYRNNVPDDIYYD